MYEFGFYTRVSDECYKVCVRQLRPFENAFASRGQLCCFYAVHRVKWGGGKKRRVSEREREREREKETERGEKILWNSVHKFINESAREMLFTGRR